MLVRLPNKRSSQRTPPIKIVVAQLMGFIRDFIGIKLEFLLVERPISEHKEYMGLESMVEYQNLHHRNKMVVNLVYSVTKAKNQKDLIHALTSVSGELKLTKKQATNLTDKEEFCLVNNINKNQTTIIHYSRKTKAEAFEKKLKETCSNRAWVCPSTTQQE
jgi:hypothetical protein